MPAEQRVPTASEGRDAAINRLNLHAQVIDYPGGEIGLRRDAMLAFAAQPASGAGVRIDRSDFPEIIQAVRWSDEDNGTNHFEPGIGFVVDDPDGVTVPERWVEHLPLIEAALAGLDHEAPHPLDVDTIEYLEKNGQEPTIHDSAAYCFVCGEHTPMTAMQRTSRELWIASRFLNEYFEGWAFDPASGWEHALPTTEVEPATSAGMVSWHGGDHAPEDWEHPLPIRFRDGTEATESDTGEWYWKHDGDACDIIAYTPKPQPAEVELHTPEVRDGIEENWRKIAELKDAQVRERVGAALDQMRSGMLHSEKIDLILAALPRSGREG